MLTTVFKNNLILKHNTHRFRNIDNQSFSLKVRVCYDFTIFQDIYIMIVLSQKRKYGCRCLNFTYRTNRNNYAITYSDIYKNHTKFTFLSNLRPKTFSGKFSKRSSNLLESSGSFFLVNCKRPN